jgi:phosphoserine phosphatase
MRAHVFDMDGTLLHGTSAPVLLATALGQPDALDVLEERFASGDAAAVDFYFRHALPGHARRAAGRVVAYRAARALID